MLLGLRKGDHLRGYLLGTLALALSVMAACGYRETVTYGNVPYRAQARGGNPPVVTLWHEPAWTPTPTSTPTQPPATPPATSATTARPVGDIEALICSYPWPCGEALAVMRAESGGNPYAVNARSGACGLFQLLPCACIEPQCNVEYAFRVKWAPTRTFWTHWYQFWE